MAPTVTTTSPVEGVQPGTKVTVSAERADWLIANGYATDLKNDDDHTDDTDVEQSKLPTYSDNDKQVEKDAADADKAENAPEVGKGEPATPAPVDTVAGTNEAPDTTPTLERLRQDYNERTAGTNETAAYDPADYNVDEVNEYLASASDAERDRVLKAERKGEARKGILGE